MKKIICITLAMLLIIFSVGCKKNVNNNPQETLQTSPASDSVTEPASSTRENNSVVFNYSYKVPCKKIVIDVPDYQRINNGFMELYILHGERYVGVTADVITKVSSLQEAHNAAFGFYLMAIQNYSFVNSINITKESYETVNGIDVYKYEGTVNCGQSKIYDAFVIGYSFIMDDTPCNITGSVINQSQDEEQIAEIKNIVEAMIKTLRSEL